MKTDRVLGGLILNGVKVFGHLVTTSPRIRSRCQIFQTFRPNELKNASFWLTNAVGLKFRENWNFSSWFLVPRDDVTAKILTYSRKKYFGGLTLELWKTCYKSVLLKHDTNYVNVQNIFIICSRTARLTPGWSYGKSVSISSNDELPTILATPICAPPSLGVPKHHRYHISGWIPRRCSAASKNDKSCLAWCVSCLTKTLIQNEKKRASRCCCSPVPHFFCWMISLEPSFMWVTIWKIKAQTPHFSP